MNLSSDEIQKLKVVELRAELSARGLDSRGVKAVLVDRLLGAMSEVGPGGNLNGSSLLASREPQADSLLSEQDEEMETGENVLQESTPPVKFLSSHQLDIQEPLTSDPNKDDSLDLQLSEFEPPAQLLEEDSAEVSEAGNDIEPSSERNGDDGVEIKETTEEESQEDMEGDTAESQEGTDETKEGENGGKEENGTKRKIEEVNGGRESGGFKKRKPHQEPQIVIPPLNEPDYDENLVLLDWYKSDLNLKISTEDFLSAEPLVFDEFPLAFAGAFGSWGFKQGKICYEVTWKENSQVKADFGKAESEAKHILRLGWSDLYSGMQLGEQKFSFGYDSRGRFFNGGEVKELGEGTTFAEGDTICAYLDLQAESMELKFTKNGEAVGETIQIPKELEGKVWYPHILSRNVKFEANFGEKEPSHPIFEGYEFLSKITSEDSKVRGPVRPATKDDCEFVMLCGMACCGKTTWAKEHSRANPDKHYNILGTSTVVERAVSSPGSPTSPIDGFLQKAGKFVEKLIEIAPSRKRHYILDQSNVTLGSQQRKSGGFEGFRRRAVLILPSDEEYQKRIKAKEQEQGKSVPKSTILDMKANFQVPVVGPLFSTVDFPELGQTEAEELIAKYNKEGARHAIKSIDLNRFGNRRGMPMRGGRGGFRGGRGGPPRGGRGFFRGGDSRGGAGGRGGPWPRRGGGPGIFAGGRGGPPSLGPPRGGGGGRGIPPLRGGPPRPMFGAGGGGGRGMRGGGGGGGPPRGSPMAPNRGSFGRGGGDRGGGNQGRNPPRGGFGGGRGTNNGGGAGAPRIDRRGNPGGSRGFSGNNAGGGGGRWGNSPSGGFGNNNRRGGGGQGGFQQQWGNGGGQNWGGNRSGNNSGFGGGGGGGGGFGGGPDPWAVQQQVPDQGYGLSWENGGGNQGGGGGTWQGYGGQTYGNFGYGRK